MFRRPPAQTAARKSCSRYCNGTLKKLEAAKAAGLRLTSSLGLRPKWPHSHLRAEVRRGRGRGSRLWELPDARPQPVFPSGHVKVTGPTPSRKRADGAPSGRPFAPGPQTLATRIVVFGQRRRPPRAGCFPRRSRPSNSSVDSERRAAREEGRSHARQSPSRCRALLNRNQQSVNTARRGWRWSGPIGTIPTSADDRLLSPSASEA